MARKKTTKKAAKKTAAKKTTKELSQAHGKVEEFQPTTLDQIWGDDGTSRYKTLDSDEYQEYMNGLAMADLQAHAVKIGLIPIDNATQLKKRLMTEFKKFTSNYKVPKKKINNNLDLSKEARRTLSEGK